MGILDPVVHARGVDDGQNRGGLFPSGDDILAWEGGHFTNTSYPRAQLREKFRDV